jgi:glycosyltransferase involved in cell wall biosynthesis
VLDHGAYRAAFDRELATHPMGLRGAVTELGVVDDDDVPAIFRLASVLAFPSLHEGFGLAALEGLAARLPVVASRRAPLTEFLDESCAILVDPTSDVDIACGIVEALRESCRARSDAGELRARTHSWSRVAALHLEHYRGLRSRRHDEVHHA